MFIVNSLTVKCIMHDSDMHFGFKKKHIFLREETTLLLFMLKKTAVIIVKYIYLIKIAYYNLAIYFIF